MSFKDWPDFRYAIPALVYVHRFTCLEQLTPNDVPDVRVIPGLQLTPPVQWTTDRTSVVPTTPEFDLLLRWISKRPWQWKGSDVSRFLGYDQAWACILALVLLLKSNSSPGTATESGSRRIDIAPAPGSADLTSEVKLCLYDFLETLRDLEGLYAWPGVPPALCYTAFASRGGYLMALRDDEYYQAIVRWSGNHLVRR